MKRGLKSLAALAPQIHSIRVKEDSPMKRGLKYRLRHAIWQLPAR